MSRPPENSKGVEAVDADGAVPGLHAVVVCCGVAHARCTVHVPFKHDSDMLLQGIVIRQMLFKHALPCCIALPVEE